MPQEALLWRDVSDLSAIDLSAIDLSARLGGSSDFSVAERDLGAPSLSIATKTCPRCRYPDPGARTRPVNSREVELARPISAISFITHKHNITLSLPQTAIRRFINTRGIHGAWRMGS